LNALGLARAGVSVVVLEAAPGIVRSPRAMVYHWSVLAGLDRLGVLEEVKATGFTKNDYRFQVYKTGEKIEWSLDVLRGHVKHPYNVHLGQDRLADIALARLQALGATVHWNARVKAVQQDGSSVTVVADTPDGERRFEADWMIGADGARSAVRSSLGLEFAGTTWEPRFVATNIRVDLEAHGYARSTLQIDDTWGAIIAKIDNSNLWRCTYCEKDPALAESTVAERIPASMRQVLPGVPDYELVQFSPYRMHQRAADTFRVGRVLLAGDAAHATNPTGGLGLTSGLFDTYVLYEALAAVIQADAGEEILDRYAEERRRMFLEIASPQASENFRLLFLSSDPAKLEQRLTVMRRLASDPDFAREQALFTRQLETPSLLTGRRTHESA
ncbi:MAG TPA: FAD-dependent monooxygenase, partial [Ramlibacter sp.]